MPASDASTPVSRRSQPPANSTAPRHDIQAPPVRLRIIPRISSARFTQADASLEVLVPAAHAGRDALIRRCRLLTAPASTFSLPPAFPSSANHRQTSSLRFYAVESDGCSPACGNCEKALHASTDPLIRARPSLKLGRGRSIKASSVLSAESARFANPRLTNHARLHQSVRCLPASHAPRRSPSTRRSATRSRRLRDLAERFPPGGAPGVQLLPFAGLIPFRG